MYSNFGRATMEIMRSIERGGYPDPADIRELFEEKNFAIPTFAQNLWDSLTTAYPCALQMKMVRSFLNAGYEAAAQYLPENRQQAWLDHCSKGNVSEPDDAQALVREFLGSVCISNPICRPCSCKKRLIDFYERFENSRESAKRLINCWLTGTIVPNKKETFIRLGYALSLRAYPIGYEPDAQERKGEINRFLCFMCGQNPLHLSEPSEAVHWFCLKDPGDLSPFENYVRAMDMIDNISSNDSGCDMTGVFTMKVGESLERVKTEDELVAMISSGGLFIHDSYYTAKRHFRRFLEDYEIVLDNCGLLDEQVRRGRMPTKEQSLRLIKLIELFSKGASVNAGELSDYLSRYSISDVLYASGRLKDVLNGTAQTDRTLLMLTVMAMNYGIRYDSALSMVSETDELTDQRSFNDFCNTLSDILKRCSMAPLYPRRRLDFMVLYAYYLMSRRPKGTMCQSLSWYFASAIKESMNKTDG